MNKIVHLKEIFKPNDIVVLDTMSGRFGRQSSEAVHIQGNYCVMADQEVSVFTADGNLYFQWNDRRWNLKGLASAVRYVHDFQGRMTSFSVGDVTIRYRAWWADDPTFEPNEPERDEDEDFFAYVASLAHNESLQRILIDSWDK